MKRKFRAAEGSFAEAWEMFSTATMPLAAGPEQRRQTRVAFYAGAWSLLQNLQSFVGEDGEATPAEVAHLTALNEEIRAFLAAVQKAGL